MDLNQLKSELLSQGLCNHCLGRQFALLGTGLENYQRGYLLRNTKNLSKSDFKINNIPQDLEVGGECFLCEGAFDKLDDYTNLVVEALQDYELDTILVGTRPTDRLKKKEQQLWNDYGNQYAELLKKEFNRLIAKRVMTKLKIDSEFERADIQVVIDLETKDVNLQVSSVLIHGQYNKYTRDISQTTWNYSNNSIQQIIQQSFIKAAKAENAKFHGAGREDLDVRCLGKRDFILELMHPKKRRLDLDQLTNNLIQSQDKVEIFNLKFVQPAKKKEIKQKNVDKTYKALVQLESTVTKSELNNLESLVGMIEQRTPKRVGKTRTDKIRKREVYRVLAEKMSTKKVELIIKAEAGTYIKELISGDKNRTKPSVANILNTDAQCKSLDVISIEE